MNELHGFSDEEWALLHRAVLESIAFVSLVDRGRPWSSIPQFFASEQYLANQTIGASSEFIRDLCGTIVVRWDARIERTRDQVARDAVSSVVAAASIVAEKKPAELDSFKKLLLGGAREASKSAWGRPFADGNDIDVLVKALA